MADLKPIGSEKLQGMEKIARIMEIARYGEKPKEEINLNETVSFTKTLADGYVYGVVKEKNGYIVKKGINESSLDYMDQLQNRKYYNSYSQALKKLNLVAGEVNRLTENESEVSLFGEEKKFVLKTPKQAAPAPDMSTPAPDLSAPAPDMSAPAPEASVPAPDMGAEPMGDMGAEPMGDMGAEPMGDMGAEPTGDMGAEPTGDEGEEVTFKTIQKLTGKLGQKLRTFGQENEMSSEDVKYVVNSVLSALDLTVLDDADLESIIGKIEGTEESGAQDMGEPSLEPTSDEVPADLGADGSSEISVEPEVGESKNPHSRFLEQLFSESKVDKVLSKYFVITEEEKKENEKKKINTFIKKKVNKVSVVDEIKRLSETIEQELTAEFILSENENAKFIGKTNMKNLIFENEGKQIKVSPKGVILWTS